MIISVSLQSLNKFKIVYVSSGIGFLLNALLDIPFMYLFHLMGLEAFYGAILATIVGYIFSYIYSLSKLKIELNFSYKSILDTIKETLVPTLAMIFVLVVLKLFIKVPTSGIMLVLTLMLYVVFGGLTYIFVSYKTGLLERTLGREYINKIIGKLRRNK